MSRPPSVGYQPEVEPETEAQRATKQVHTVMNAAMAIGQSTKAPLVCCYAARVFPGYGLSPFAGADREARRGSVAVGCDHSSRRNELLGRTRARAPLRGKRECCS